VKIVYRFGKWFCLLIYIIIRGRVVNIGEITHCLCEIIDINDVVNSLNKASITAESSEILRIKA